MDRSFLWVLFGGGKDLEHAFSGVLFKSLELLTGNNVYQEIKYFCIVNAGINVAFLA